MNFTILGASGFVGSYLVKTLRKALHEVYTPARGDIDIYNRSLGHVLYCVGLTADFRVRPYETVRAHISVLADLLEKADFESLVYLSSTRVYARSSTGEESSPLIVDPSDPSDLYNLSKLAGESLCRSCGHKAVKVARLSTIVGYDPQADNFLPTLIREALSGRIELQSALASAKDYILLNDAATLLPRIALEGQGGCYNVASGINISHREIVSRLADLTGCEVFVMPGAPLQDFPIVNISRIQSEFGFTHASVLDAMPAMVEACRAGTR